MGSPLENIEAKKGASGELAILIVAKRDEAGILELEAEFMGHVSRIVFDYFEAISTARENSFDLIIMDMDFPKGDWLNTIKEIRDAAGDVHIITMTDNNSREIEQQAREQKVIYYIVKPLDMKEMRSVIYHVSKKKIG